MKILYLGDICKAIGGSVPDSSKRLLIKKVVKRIEELRNNCLCFSFKKNISFDFMEYKNLSNAVIVTDDIKSMPPMPNLIYIEVKDIEEAYLKFIDYYRSHFVIPFVGITGTCGKTTTKELLKHILRDEMQIVSTYDNNNELAYNHDYLLQVDDMTDAVIIEMGVAYPNNLLKSCRFFKPQIGIITSIGTDHLNGFFTQENYIAEKASLLKGMANEGTLILNADDSNIATINLENFQGKIIYYGTDSKAQFKVENIGFTNKGMKFNLRYADKCYNLFLPVYGEHFVYNAVAAIATATELGISLDYAAQRLESYQGLEHRLNVLKGINNTIIIDDSFSSNLTSIESSLRVLKNLSEGKKSVAIIGTMPRMGNASIETHKKVAKLISDLDINYLITVGEYAKYTASEALKLGLSKDKCIICDHSQDVIQLLLPLLTPDTYILVKMEGGGHYILQNTVLA